MFGKLLCARRLGSLDSLHASVPEKGLEAHETVLAIQTDLLSSSVELDMHVSQWDVDERRVLAQCSLRQLES